MLAQMTKLLMLVAAHAEMIKLASFDGTSGETFKWQLTNDPVMGGKSTSTFKEENNLGVFDGLCAIVPSLKAPGFAKVTTARAEPHAFKDVSSTIGGGIVLRVKSTTPEYKGFRVAFAAKGVPHTSIFGGGSFKSGFNVTKNNEFEEVFVPFTDFSYDWSGFTGGCDTKDPNGQQHHCCSKDETPTSGPKYCPTATFLKEISDLEVWAEGSEGNFHIEIDYIGASDSSPAPGPGPAPTGKSIVDLALATADLSTLVTALKAGKLVDTLSGPGPFTVFAPTNEAFAKIPKATLDHLLDPQNIHELQDILTYHVASGSVHAKDLKDKEEIKTVEGKDVEAHITRVGVFINNAAVTKADIDASNGVIHIINEVLLPPKATVTLRGAVIA